VDALRGAIMMLMAIDHIRDYVARSAMHFSPTDLNRTTPAIFLTRWITHFCAPVFILTAGVGACLWEARGNRSNRQLSGFLFTRGLWLILLELTVLRVIMFSNFSYRHEPVLLLILWAIGLSMIALSVLVYLPKPVLLLLGTVIILLHDLLDAVPARRFGSGAPLWDVLHAQGVFTFGGVAFITAYPILPWIGVIVLGYCLGQMFSWEAPRRQRLLIASGVLLTSGFVLLRVIDRYGDPAPWIHRSSVGFTILSFLNVTKYPPSLDFLLMTLGPALILLALLERVRLARSNPLLVFGRVPFFFYVAHLFLAHLVAIVLNLVRYGGKPFVWIAPPAMGSANALFPTNFGYPLWVVYAVWVLLLAFLYPACMWFSHVKQRRSDWWLGYL